ncbi:amphi-Trp domain-containing protein [Gulosibacter macacae]|uniref:Amphi-Trp domain-containing protein n=2 Tax=Gulosibacter macacae TaxID=2488791 RepID=A0A3P3VTZ9_9MICO|nr:amphi-Trp domain-containing protein [Gulosibacter macacae]
MRAGSREEHPRVSLRRPIGRCSCRHESALSRGNQVDLGECKRLLPVRARDQRSRPMSESIKVFKTESDMSRERLADLLHNIADRIDEGRVTLSQGESRAVIELPSELRVSIEVSDEISLESTKRELEIEVEWHLDANGQPIDEAASGTLTIS